jgi:cbb3-type cytochrome oxidase subunit 3
MNPLIREAVGSVQLTWILGLMTVLFLASFLYWVWWAYTPKHKEYHEEAAQLPFMDGEN